MQPGVKRAPRSPTILVFDANVAFLFDDLAVSVTLVVGFVVGEIGTANSLSSPAKAAAMRALPPPIALYYHS
ncbi:hypothetical protein NHJ6243_001610 [Beauveria neobassiana]